MLTAYWGATGDIGIIWPDNISGWLLLLCSVVIFGVLLFLDRERLSRFSAKQWILLLALSGLGFLFSQLLPTPVPSWLADLWPSFGESQVKAVVLLSAVFYLLAGAILSPGAALIVGFCTGLGHALGLTQQPYTPFHFAFAAWLASQLMQQNYQGRFYAWLRLPLVSGAIAQTSAAVFAALAVLVNTNGLLAALDAALSTFQTLFWPFLIEGLVGGALVTVILKGMAQWLPQRRLVPSPSQRSVRSYLLTNVLIFGGAVLLSSAVFVFALSIFLSSRLLVTEMAANSNAASALIEEFRYDLEVVLSQSAADDDFGQGDKASAERALGRVYRAAKHFQEVILVDEQIGVFDAFPAADAGVALSGPEQEAVARALKDGLRTPVVTEIPGQGRTLSMVVPVMAKEGQRPRALVGRVRMAKLAEILDDLRLSDSSSLVIDREEHVLTASGSSGPSVWLDPQAGGAQGLFVPAYLGGEAFLMENARQSRDIHYLSPPNRYAWRVVMSMPYEFVLNQAFASVLPVMLILLAATAVFYARFASYGQSLARPISDLARTSRVIAAGGSLTTTVDVDQRQDEVGELGRAFKGMQQALKVRLDDLSLLLAVSQDISTSIDISQSMPIILQGALRGTGASGARAVILNPSGRVPLTFAEGPAGDDLVVLDRTLMATMRDKKEFGLNSARGMGQLFGMPLEALPAKAFFALPLLSQNRLQGVFFLGYRQAHELSGSEKDLLYTLAGQATVLVENARLFAKAEEGRQHLKAVLDSTAEAVIVTDRSERVLIINEAMEKAFLISANQVLGRIVKDVLPSPDLLLALERAAADRNNLELEGKDGRTYTANVSTIFDRQRQEIGRVAVLHDVTQFKEVDRLKSEFVSNVSHDIKTPLTIISSSASQLAITDNFTAEQRGYTDNIIASVERMVNLVDNLLDLSRLEGGLDLIYEQFDVGSLLTDLADDHWLHAHNGGVTIRTKVAEDVPLLTADRAWLYQAVQNLLTNAFKYAPNSGELLLSAVRSGEQIVISLRDRGPGIAKENQVRLFEKFYRVKRHGSGQVKGTGLGLALVKTVADRHGGQAWCRSELGKGSVFSIAVPVDGEKQTTNNR